MADGATQTPSDQQRLEQIAEHMTWLHGRIDGDHHISKDLDARDANIAHRALERIARRAEGRGAVILAGIGKEG